MSITVLRGFDEDRFSETLWDTPLQDMYKDPSTEMYPGTPLTKVVTLRDLLAHRTGVSDHNGLFLIGESKPRKYLWKNIHKLKPQEPISKYFRSSFNYNNWMYGLVGHILEEVNQVRLETFEVRWCRMAFREIGGVTSLTRFKAGSWPSRGGATWINCKLVFCPLQCMWIHNGSNEVDNFRLIWTIPSQFERSISKCQCLSTKTGIIDNLFWTTFNAFTINKMSLKSNSC